MASFRYINDQVIGDGGTAANATEHVVDVEATYAQYAAHIGKTVDDLTYAEKLDALQREILRQLPCACGHEKR